MSFVRQLSCCIWLLMLPVSHGLVPVSSQLRLQQPLRVSQTRSLCMSDRRTGRRVGGRVDEPELPPSPPAPLAPLEPETEIPAGAVVALAALGVLASLLAALKLLGGSSSSSDFYFYSSTYEESVVVRGSANGEPKVETRRQESVRTNIPQGNRAGIERSIFPLERY